MENIKPPIGLMPKFLWDSERLADIISAINRYLQAEKEIPLEWINEYNDLIKNKCVQLGHILVMGCHFG